MEEILKILDNVEFLEATHYALIEIDGHEFDIEILESDTVGDSNGSDEYIVKVKLLAVDDQEPTEEVIQKFKELVEKKLVVYVNGDDYNDKY